MDGIRDEESILIEFINESEEVAVGFQDWLYEKDRRRLSEIIIHQELVIISWPSDIKVQSAKKTKKKLGEATFKCKVIKVLAAGGRDEMMKVLETYKKVGNITTLKEDRKKYAKKDMSQYVVDIPKKTSSKKSKLEEESNGEKDIESVPNDGLHKISKTSKTPVISIKRLDSQAAEQNQTRRKYTSKLNKLENVKDGDDSEEDDEIFTQTLPSEGGNDDFPDEGGSEFRMETEEDENGGDNYLISEYGRESDIEDVVTTKRNGSRRQKNESKELKDESRMNKGIGKDLISIDNLVTDVESEKEEREKITEFPDEGEQFEKSIEDSTPAIPKKKKINKKKKKKEEEDEDVSKSKDQVVESICTPPKNKKNKKKKQIEDEEILLDENIELEKEIKSSSIDPDSVRNVKKLEKTKTKKNKKETTTPDQDSSPIESVEQKNQGLSTLREEKVRKGEKSEDRRKSDSRKIQKDNVGALNQDADNKHIVNVSEKTSSSLKRKRETDLTHQEHEYDDPPIKKKKKEPKEKDRGFQTLSEDFIKTLHWASVQTISSDLLDNLFDDKTLRKSSPTGKQCNAVPDRESKPALDPKKMEYIAEIVARKFGRHPPIPAMIRKTASNKIATLRRAYKNKKALKKQRSSNE